MSDDWTILVPHDPLFVPTDAGQAAARARFAEIAPDADEIELVVHSGVQFFDCGANFERVICPACRLVLPLDWWQKAMDADYAGHFKLSTFSTPCCGASARLNDLVYEWPQSFGRFALSAMNANVGELSPQYREELSALVGSELRVIYQHI